MNHRTRYLQGCSVLTPKLTPVLQFDDWFALLSDAEKARYRAAELAHLTREAHKLHARRDDSASP